MPYFHSYFNVSLYSGHLILLPHGDQSQAHKVVFIRVCTLFSFKLIMQMASLLEEKWASEKLSTSHVRSFLSAFKNKDPP
jgi:hypothetical protein